MKITLTTYSLLKTFVSIKSVLLLKFLFCSVFRYAAGDLWTDKELPNNIHSHCKYEQATRLSALADYVVCKNGTLEAATGPFLESFEFDDDMHTAILTFANVGKGLATCDGGKAVTGIKVYPTKYAGMRDEVPVSAEIISKNQIKVTHKKSIKAVGYNAVAEDLYGETILNK